MLLLLLLVQSKVLEMNTLNLKALLLRIRCYKSREKYEEVVKAYEDALKISKTRD